MDSASYPKQAYLSPASAAAGGNKSRVHSARSSRAQSSRAPSSPSSPAAATARRGHQQRSCSSSTVASFSAEGSGTTDRASRGTAAQHQRQRQHQHGQEQQQQQEELPRQEPQIPVHSYDTSSIPSGRNIVSAAFALLGLLGGIFLTAAAARFLLPESHFLQKYVQKILLYAPRFGAASSFRIQPVLEQAAEGCKAEGFHVAAEWLQAAARYPHADHFFLFFSSLLFVLLFAFFAKGLWSYKRERDVETSLPATIFCSNMMTSQEFKNREYTYKALASLMKDPEYLRLKALRASEGAKAWNWQKRAEEKVVADGEESEDEGSGEESNCPKMTQ